MGTRKKKNPPVRSVKKKSPPKRKKKSPVTPGPHLVQVTIPVDPSAPIPQNRNTNVRTQAGLYYISNMWGASLGDMSKMKEFSGVTQRTLEIWSVRDKWTERRKKFQDDVNTAVSAALLTEVAQIRKTQLETLQGIFDSAVERFKSKEGPPISVTSYEGLFSAIFRASVQLDKMRSDLAGDVPPIIAGGPSSGGEVVPKLDPQEARDAALFLVERRRRMQAEAAETLQDSSLGGGEDQDEE